MADSLFQDRAVGPGLLNGVLLPKDMGAIPKEKETVFDYKAQVLSKWFRTMEKKTYWVLLTVWV